MSRNIFRSKKKSNTTKNIVSCTAVGTLIIGACIGNLKMKEWTDNKPPEIYLVDKLTGKADVEKQYAIESTMYRQEIEKLKAENRRFIEFTSRGNVSREVIDFNKLPGPIYLLELTARKCYEKGFKSMGEIYSIIRYESNFDPTCHNTNGEDSRGLLQVNVADKAHAIRNPNKTKLFDPAYNLDYQLEELYDYYLLGQKKGLSGAELAKFMSRYGQRPRWSESISKQIDIAYADFKKSVIKEAK